MKKQILFFVLIVLLSGCTYFGQNKPKKEYFTLWNTCEALTALQAYVEDVTNPQSPNFIPVEDVFKSCWAFTSSKSTSKRGESAGSGTMGAVLMSKEAPRLA